MIGGVRNTYWDAYSTHHDSLVLDMSRGAQVSGDSPVLSDSHTRALNTLGATLHGLREDQKLGSGGSSVKHFPSARGRLTPMSPTHGSPTSQPSVAELSSRRREAIRAAFRRIDRSGRGWVSVEDAATGLRKFCSIPAGEQDQVLHGLRSGQAGGPAGRISWNAFANYYLVLGSRVELDREFEDLLRQHWGFADVSNILADMKNKFAMVGLACAFRNCLEHGGAEASPQDFQEAINHVGIDYGSDEVRRIFEAFACAGSMDVHRFIAHLTSAPRPPTPIASAGGAGHASLAQTGGFSHIGYPQSPASVGGKHHELPEPVAAPPIYSAPPGLPEPPPAPAEDTDGEPPKAPPEEHEDPVEAPAPDEEEPQAPAERDLHIDESEPPLAPQERGLAMSYQPSPYGSPMSPSAAAMGGYGASTSPSRNPSTSVEGSSSSGRRRAVTIGVNYIGQKVKLDGCINDSDTFIKLLTEEFNYDVADIRQLRDDHPQRMPTRKNMLAALRWLVNGARCGDHLFFHYSGHGSQQQDTDGDELDGRDDTLVPCDYSTNGMLSDDELRRLLVQDLPKGVRLTAILDCCHSGTALDLPYKITVSPGSDDMLDVKKKAAHKVLRPSAGDVVMLSGCKDNQTSADAGIGLAGNKKAAGAMTTAFKNVISKRPTGSYHDVLLQMRKFLKSNGFEQVPQLSSEHFLKIGDCFMPEAQPPDVAPERPLRAPVRKALTIGINYMCLSPGRGRLSGCINDSETMVGIMKDTFGFQDSQICRLRDDRSNVMPTKANILASLRWLTQGAAAGDELFFHYSGHGGQVTDKSGDEASGKDDTLIPCDFQSEGQITDDDLHEHIVQPLSKGVRMWVMLDCCHSGTALDLPFKASVDGNNMQISRSRRQRGGPPESRAEVIMISGCKDTQTSADVSAGSMGVSKAAGAMTTAFRHCVTPTITCEDMLLRMRDYLKRNKYDQVPQMSSEQYIQLDASFVDYAAKHHSERVARPPPTSPMPMSSPVPTIQSVSPMVHSQSSPLVGQAHLLGHHAQAAMYAHYPMHHYGNQVSSPMHRMPGQVTSPSGMSWQHDGSGMMGEHPHDRINKLEAQLAELRKSAQSPSSAAHSAYASPMRQQW